MNEYTRQQMQNGEPVQQALPCLFSELAIGQEFYQPRILQSEEQERPVLKKITECTARHIYTKSVEYFVIDSLIVPVTCLTHTDSIPANEAVSYDDAETILFCSNPEFALDRLSLPDSWESTQHS